MPKSHFCTPHIREVVRQSYKQGGKSAISDNHNHLYDKCWSIIFATCVSLSNTSQLSSARRHLRKKSAKNRTKARSGRTLRIRPCNHGCVDNQPFRRILIVTQGLFYAKRAGPCGSFLCSCRHSMMRFCAGMRDFRQPSI